MTKIILKRYYLDNDDVLLIYHNKVQVLVAQVHLPDYDETMHGKGETRRVTH